MRFRPCIDLHNGRVKQIVGSTFRDGVEPVTNFLAEQPPCYFAELYRSSNLFGGHVIMLGKGNEVAATEALQAYPGGLQVGGGITPDNARYYLDAGASHVIVTSFIFHDGKLHWDRLELMKRAVGRKRLVLDLSCKRRDKGYVVVTDRWQHESSELVHPELFERLGGYCDEFLVHAADVEGMRCGIDEALVRLLGECAVQPITYAGGVRSFDDLEAIARAGKERIDVTIGSALDLFGGDIAFREVVKWFEQKKNRG